MRIFGKRPFPLAAGNYSLPNPQRKSKRFFEKLSYFMYKKRLPQNAGQPIEISYMF
jgi:hypothetical protein